MINKLTFCLSFNVTEFGKKSIKNIFSWQFILIGILLYAKSKILRFDMEQYCKEAFICCQYFWREDNFWNT